MPTSFDYDVFISHSAKDKPIVWELAQKLKNDGLRVWFDEWEIKPGDMIGLKIEQGLEKSRTLILVMSKAAFESEWVSLERHTLLFRDPTNSKRRFIPVLIEDCQIPDVIAQFAYIDWREKAVKAYEELMVACKIVEEKNIELQNKKEIVIKESRVIKSHDNVLSIAITPDGKKIISGSGKDDGNIEIFDLESGQSLAKFSGHKSLIFGIAVMPDNKTFITSSRDNFIKVWDIESKECITYFTNISGFSKVIISPDSKKIISVLTNFSLIVFNIESKKLVAEFTGHKGYIPTWALDITPDGERVVSGSADKTIKIWDIETGQCLTTFKGHSRVIFGIAISPNGKKFISSSGDRTLKIWGLESGQCLAALEGHTDDVNGLAITSDSKIVFSASVDKTIKAWDIESGKCLVTFKGHSKEVYDVKITPEGKRIVSCSKDGTIRIWEIPDFIKCIDHSTSTRYTNAKVLLVGDSGVGKSGLALRLTRNCFEATVSTDAAWATQLKLPHNTNTTGIEREIWIWDFAGQSDYRLIHQLYMEDFPGGIYFYLGMHLTKVPTRCRI
jgi:WD40 repeat protein